MPSLELDIFKKIQENIKRSENDIFISYPTFVETGTYLGRTTFSVEPLFNCIYTIEIKEKFYKDVKKKYKGNKIKFHLGDSSVCLNKICEGINTNAIFFLDGHWSAGDTGKGEKDCPLYEELNIIVEKFYNKAIIIIDDVRLFGMGPNKGNEICNWEDINKNKILDIVKNRLETYYSLHSYLANDDRLILHINN